MYTCTSCISPHTTGSDSFSAILLRTQMLIDHDDESNCSLTNNLYNMLTNSVYRGKCPFSNQSVQSFHCTCHLFACTCSRLNTCYTRGIIFGMYLVEMYMYKLNIRENRNVWLQTSAHPTLHFIYRKSQNVSTATFIYFSIALDKMLFDINRQ